MFSMWDMAHRRVRCRLITDAPDAALVLRSPVEAERAQLMNALSQGDRACVFVQNKGGWRRGAPATPNELAAEQKSAAGEIRAALLALPQF